MAALHFRDQCWSFLKMYKCSNSVKYVCSNFLCAILNVYMLFVGAI